MKKVFNKICAVLQALRVSSEQRFWATWSQCLVEVFQQEGFSGVWGIYTDYVRQYISLNDKEMFASAIAVAIIVADFLRPSVLWIIFTVEGLVKGYPPSVFEQRAKALMRLPVGQTLDLMLKVIVISAIFWWFKS